MGRVLQPLFTATELREPYVEPPTTKIGLAERLRGARWFYALAGLVLLGIHGYQIIDTKLWTAVAKARIKKVDVERNYKGRQIVVENYHSEAVPRAEFELAKFDQLQGIGAHLAGIALGIGLILLATVTAQIGPVCSLVALVLGIGSLTCAPGLDLFSGTSWLGIKLPINLVLYRIVSVMFPRESVKAF